MLSFWEDSVGVAPGWRRRSGLPGNPPEAVDAARSKVRTRELSTALGLPSPRARRVRSLDELFAAAAVGRVPGRREARVRRGAMGCVRVDDLDSLPKIYSLVRSVVTPEHDGIFRTGNDLLARGVPRRRRVRRRPRDARRRVRVLERLAELADGRALVPGDRAALPARSRPKVPWPGSSTSCVATARAFGLHRGVLHIEGKATSRGPRIVEVNARMGGGRVHEYVRQVWGVDLVEAPCARASTSHRP